MRRLCLAFMLSLSLSAASSCTRKGPAEIALHRDTCDYCRMVISNRAFAAELVNERGKVFKFDSIECLAAFRATSGQKEGSSWVSDLPNPEKWVRAPEAAYLKSEKLPSPMGLGLSAYSTDAARDEARKLHGGEPMSWEAVQEFVRSSGFIREATPAATTH